LRRVKLKDVAEINPGKSEIDKDAVDQVSFVAMADVSEEGFISNHENRSLTEVYKGYTYFKKNDVLLAKITPCFENGKAAIADNIPNEIGFGSSEFHVLRTNGEILPKYLFYALWNEQFRKHGSRKMTGSAGQKRIPTNFLKNYEIPLPSLSEQKAIVAKLDRAQRLIDIDREMLAKYDELIQSVFLEMFGDPVRNEKGWEVKKLGDIGTLARGKSKHRPRNDPSILGGEYPLIQTGDVANAGLFITEYSSTYNEAGLKQSKLWDKGTLCITIAANIAKVGILDFDACFPDSVVGFKSEKASSIFIYAWMGFLQNIIEEQAPVSAQKNINLRILNDLDIIFPPLSLQREYEQIVLKIDRERREIENLNQKSEELFSSLVQGVFGN
jgi:type I restriction enzyme, S subunit